MTAMAKAWTGETAVTLPFFEQASKTEPRLAQLPDYFDLLSRNYANQGMYDEGLKASERAYQLAIAAGRSQQAAKLQQRAAECRRMGAKAALKPQ